MSPPQQELDPINQKIEKKSVVDLSPSTIQVDGNIYDTAKLADYHPGGELFVKAFSGRDATEAFLSYHRREFPHNKMSEYLAGSNTPLKKSDADKEYLELCKIIEQVLPRNKSFAPLSYYIKIFVLLSVTVGLEVYIHTTKSYKWYLTALIGWFFALIGLNIQHDANHGAVSRNPLVNRILGLTQNWIGGSALGWIHQHVVQHHINPNDVEQDPDIVGNEFLRLNPLKPLLKHQSLQHLYLFLLLGLFGFTYIVDSLLHNIHGFHKIRMSELVKSNRVFEVVTTTIFALRWLLLPLYQSPSVYTLLNIAPMYMVGGYYLAMFFVISHNFEGVDLFEKAYLEKKDQSFLRKQVGSSSNVGGSFLCFLNGGLNYQIEHHLFPRIQHSHYSTIAPVVREFCKSKGINYVHFPTVSDNIESCMRHLFQMGHSPTPEGYKTISAQ